MSTPTRPRRTTGFFVGFFVIALLIAGGLSYLASGDPDGLDTVTLEGCQLSAEGEPQGGSCIAQNAQEHGMAGSPLADYALGGGAGTVGVAGVIGVIVTVLVAGGLFWVLRRRAPSGSGAGGSGAAPSGPKG